MRVLAAGCFGWVLRALRGLSGVARQRVTFLCFAKEKSPKERRPAVWGPSGNLRLALKAGVCANSPAAQTARSPDPALSPIHRPSQDGTCGSGEIRTPNPTAKAPSVCAEERRARRIRARDCLSRRRVRAGPRLDRAPQVARSAAKGRRQRGRLFFGDFLLAKQKKVRRCRAPSDNPRKANQATQKELLLIQ